MRVGDRLKRVGCWGCVDGDLIVKVTAAGVGGDGDVLVLLFCFWRGGGSLDRVNLVNGKILGAPSGSVRRLRI